MILYHGTSKKNWNKIRKSEVLGLDGKKTYLSLEIKYALMHGDIILQINYNPRAEEMKIAKLVEGSTIQVVTKRKIHKFKRLTKKELQWKIR